jgi:phage shock protein PspC (stress-responsive transcriptional regulator)
MIQSIKINLNKTTFTLNNDAYNKLNNYVSALKNSFKNEPDILFDIEARIAELLTIQIAATNAEMVDANHVDEVIKTLGTVEELSSSQKNENSHSNNSNNYQSNTQNSTEKPKLRRNPFNQSLGGVCSGIANYLNVDTSFIRIAFVFAFFFFGTGVLAYIVLWIVIPKATGADADKIIQNENNNPHKLYRNKETKAIGGVCSGIALHFGIEIWVVRLAFFAGIFLWGSAILVYLIAWITIPEASNNFQKTKLNNNQNYEAQNETQLNGIRNIFNFIISGFALILLGIIIVSIFFTTITYKVFSESDIFDVFHSNILLDENINYVLTGVLLCIFTPILFLLAVISKFVFKSAISFKYAGMGLVIMFFTGVGLLIYSGVNILPKYFNQIENTEIDNQILEKNDSLHLIINEITTNKQVNYLQLNGFKIQVCDSGRFIPIDFEINETLEDSSNFSVSKFYKVNKNNPGSENDYIIKIEYQLKNDSIIFPSHYFLPKPYPFVFQRAKVKFYLKANNHFYANKTAQQAFGFINKNEKPTQYWFDINKLDDYDKWNNNDKKHNKIEREIERKQAEIERKIEEKQAEIERKLEEKEAELERKADNL